MVEKEFNFGFFQAKVRINNINLSVKTPGKDWVPCPVRIIEEVCCESDKLYYKLIIKAKKFVMHEISVPKREKSLSIINDIRWCISEIKADI